MTFEDAARKMLGAPPEAAVYSDWDTFGSDGCDTCGHGETPDTITIRAVLIERYPSGRLKPRPFPTWSRTFTDLPELWDALFQEDDT